MKNSKLSTPKLKIKAQAVFNKWIRLRDQEQRCISCGTPKVEQASHFFSAGKYNGLRFDEDNVHGSCLRCNYFLHGNLLPYRENLIKKIGIERFERLELKSQMRATVKNDRFLYLEIIEKYNTKNMVHHFGGPDREDF